MESNEKLSSWDSYIGGNFLKAENVRDFSKPFHVIDVVHESDNERPRLVLQEEERTDVSWFFDLNVTNATFLKNNGISAPLSMKEKKIWFRKTMAWSPTAKKEVDTLRIEKVE